MRALLQSLRKRGVTLEVQGDEVVCSGNDDVLTPEVIETLRTNKAEVITELRCRPHVWRIRHGVRFQEVAEL